MSRELESPKSTDWAVFIWLMVFLLIRIAIDLIIPFNETFFSPGPLSIVVLVASYVMLLNKWKVKSHLAGRDPSRIKGAWLDFAIKLFVFSCAPLTLLLLPSFLIFGYYQLILQILLWSLSLNLIQILGLAYREKILSR